MATLSTSYIIFFNETDLLRSENQNSFIECFLHPSYLTIEVQMASYLVKQLLLPDSDNLQHHSRNEGGDPAVNLWMLVDQYVSQ
jgi:hypothetical protein